MYHPWQELRNRPDITLTWQQLAPGRLAETDGHDIWMAPHPMQTWRRCTLAHELAHIDLGHTDGCSPAEETQASVLAARRLIPIESLADALVWSPLPEIVADQLWVDLDTLEVRLGHLHPAERHYIRRRLAAREEGA